jgi:phospholipid/cholesterol/gamma-HCH transport system permease protein
MGRSFSLTTPLIQLHELGVRSAALVIGGMACFGVVMIAIADAQARRFTGTLAPVGPAYLELMVRELGPLLSALLASARISASTSAELSTMGVDGQLDALELCGGSPFEDLIFLLRPSSSSTPTGWPSSTRATSTAEI